ncbi:MAG: hypothetical protein JWN24_418 [Phycisphaerales bacterium]|nr:hypothetical protein [Phycisphaerales bacterium]
MSVKIPLLALTAAVFIVCASRHALGNGGTVVTSRYEATLPSGSGKCAFTVELQAETFHLLTVANKYRVVRIKVRNNGDQPLALSRTEDGVTLRIGGKDVPGIIDLKGLDPATWNDALDDQSRTDVAYPASVPPGEEESVFVFIPLKDAPALPESINYQIKSQAGRAVEIRRPRSPSAD